MKQQKNLPLLERVIRFINFPNSYKLEIIRNYWSDIWFVINPIRIKKMSADFLLYISHDEFGKSIMKGVYDTGETKLIGKLNLRGKVVYDIGAHHGYYSFLFSKLAGSGGQVFAFEPSPRERFFFKISKFLNYSKNIHLIPFGVSSWVGKAVFYQAQGIWTGFNSLKPPRYPKGHKVKTKKFVVDLITLDSFVSLKSLPVLIKIDAEGAEFSIIRGAKNLIKLSPPLLLMEMDDKRSEAWGYKIQDFVRYLRKFGYLQFKITETGYLKRVGEQSVYEGNYFLIPEKSVGKLRHLFEKIKQNESC